jgi:rod shape-determining protein MreB and related proteins
MAASAASRRSAWRPTYAGSHIGKHHRHTAHEGRRDRRVHHHRADALVFHPQGASKPLAAAEPAHADLRAGWRHHVERHAIRVSASGAGARRTYLIEKPLAAAIGAGLPIDEAQGSMVLDIGGGTSEIAVISLNGIVYSASVRIGGDKFDDAIINYARRNYGVLIGKATAERVKQAIGTAYPGKELLEIEVKGHNLSEGVPRHFTLNSNEILESLQEPLFGIICAVKAALEQAPPELSSDVAERGVVLTGGGALLRDIDRLIMEETGIPVVIAEDPLTCVARGGGRVLEMMNSKGASFLSLE